MTFLYVLEVQVLTVVVGVVFVAPEFKDLKQNYVAL